MSESDPKKNDNACSVLGISLLDDLMTDKPGTLIEMGECNKRWNSVRILKESILGFPFDRNEMRLSYDR